MSNDKNQAEKTSESNMNNTTKPIPRVSHYGTIHIGDMEFEAVVLEDGTRGYIQNQLFQAIDFSKDNRGVRIRNFLVEFAPNYLKENEKTDVSIVVKMPHGGNANIFRVGILSEIVTGVIEAAINGTLHQQRRHLIPPCLAINKALTLTAEVALIDEATGYQYNREPDALQDFISKILRKTCATWERRFHPDYYIATFGLFGWKYSGQRNKPMAIGQITARWVYEAVFPAGIMSELREKRGVEKLHQWLTDEGGLPLLGKQIDAVTMIARTSTDLPDFNNRCAVAFHTKGQMGFIFPAPVQQAPRHT